MSDGGGFLPGTYQYLREIGCFRPVKMCFRCGRMVSKWHQHHTKRGEFVRATTEGKADDKQ